MLTTLFEMLFNIVNIYKMQRKIIAGGCVLSVI
jgi:hypothetical protein